MIGDGEKSKTLGLTDLVEPALGGEDGDVPIIAGSGSATHDAWLVCSIEKSRMGLERSGVD